MTIEINVIRYLLIFGVIVAIHYTVKYLKNKKGENKNDR